MSTHSCCSTTTAAGDPSTSAATTSHHNLLAGSGCGCSSHGAESGATGCGCSGHGDAGHLHATQDLPAPGARTISADAGTYTVLGMTCGHCVSSVTKQVSAIPGVRDVHVDLACGALALDTDAPVARADVAEAVRRAGYQLV